MEGGRKWRREDNRSMSCKGGRRGERSCSRRCFAETKKRENLPFGFLAFRKSKEFLLSLPDARQSMAFVK